MKTWIFFSAVYASLAIVAFAADERVPVGEFTATRFEKPPVIDGKVSAGRVGPGLHHLGADDALRARAAGIRDHDEPRVSTPSGSTSSSAAAAATTSGSSGSTPVSTTTTTSASRRWRSGSRLPRSCRKPIRTSSTPIRPCWTSRTSRRAATRRRAGRATGRWRVGGCRRLHHRGLRADQGFRHRGRQERRRVAIPAGAQLPGGQTALPGLVVRHPGIRRNPATPQDPLDGRRDGGAAYGRLDGPQRQVCLPGGRRRTAGRARPKRTSSYGSTQRRSGWRRRPHRAQAREAQQGRAPGRESLRRASPQGQARQFHRHGDQDGRPARSSARVSPIPPAVGRRSGR